jgi:hypothetical protein
MHLDNLVQQQANTAEATPLRVLLLLLLSGDKYDKVRQCFWHRTYY